MVMGPTHAMSGAATWLLCSTAGWIPGVTPGVIAPAIAGAAVMSGAALLPDLDSPGSMSLRDGSTAVRAFGAIGETLGHLCVTASKVVRNTVRTTADGPSSTGHRGLTHTLVFAAAVGAGATWVTALSNPVTVAGHTFSAGKLAAFVLMWSMLHLGMFGLFEAATKNLRAKYSLLAVAVVSLVITYLTVMLLPGQSYPWLGLAVAGGCVVHLIGDAITRAGVPALWPIPIRGKLWYDLALPSLLRITAGGAFEKYVLLPALTIATGLGLVWASFPHAPHAFLAS